MNNNEIKTGIWAKQSKAGNTYYGGKVVINKSEYWVTLFDNRNNKQNEKSPDFNIILKLVEETEQLKELHTTTKSDLFQDFGDSLEIDEELPF